MVTTKKIPKSLPIISARQYNEKEKKVIDKIVLFYKENINQETGEIKPILSGAYYDNAMNKIDILAFINTNKSTNEKFLNISTKVDNEYVNIGTGNPINTPEIKGIPSRFNKFKININDEKFSAFVLLKNINEKIHKDLGFTGKYDPNMPIVYAYDKEGKPKVELNLHTDQKGNEFLIGYYVSDKGQKHSITAYPQTNKTTGNTFLSIKAESQTNKNEWLDVGTATPVNARSDDKPVRFDTLILNIEHINDGSDDTVGVRVSSAVSPQLHSKLGFKQPMVTALPQKTDNTVTKTTKQKTTQKNKPKNKKKVTSSPSPTQ